MASAVNSKKRSAAESIIDELDRCRPTFAIELLERVKHIFDVPNMVVLGINRDELARRSHRFMEIFVGRISPAVL